MEIAPYYTGTVTEVDAKTGKNRYHRVGVGFAGVKDGRLQRFAVKIPPGVSLSGEVTFWWGPKDEGDSGF